MTVPCQLNIDFSSNLLHVEQGGNRRRGCRRREEALQRGCAVDNLKGRSCKNG